MRLRGSIYWVALIILFAANLPAQAGTVALNVHTEETGSCPGGSYVCVGCTYKIIAVASDCDEWDSECCWDDLEFPDWPEEVSEPVRQADGSYYSETIVTCNSVGPTTYTFRANDLVQCAPPYQENDFPAQQTLTVTGVEITAMDGPTTACPGDPLEFHVTETNPDGCLGLVTWTGGGGGGSSPQTPWIWHTTFNTPGTYDVTASICGAAGRSISVVVQEPLYEITFLDPVGVVGGKVPIRVQVRTRCAHQSVEGGTYEAQGVLIERYDPTDPYCVDGWCPVGDTQTLEYYNDENGLYTRIYRTDWNTLPLKDGSYQLRARSFFRVRPDAHEVEVIEPCTVDVINLSVTSADPEGVIAWKGEEFEDEALTVHLEDNDLTDPITLVFSFLSTARDNSMGWEMDQPVTVTKTFPDGLGGGSFTLHLNSGEWTVAPGLYTFEVEAIQTDICNSDPTLQIEDRAKYRSEHLNLFRGLDPELGPIYEAEYFGYDDKGTTEEDDDDFLYFIRLYSVSSHDPICGSEGEVQLYDPTLTMVYSCGLGGLQCLKHPTPDGLCSGEHAIVIPVPVNKMQYDGAYHFVLHVKDDHGPLYRNGENRWALDLNAVTKVLAVIVVDGDEDYLTEVGNSTTVDVKVVNAERRDSVLTKARVPITVKVTPSHLISTSCNYKEQNSEKYEWNGSPKPKADFVWKSFTSGGATTEIEDDREAYNDTLEKTIYSKSDPSRPPNEPAYDGGQFTMNLDSYDYGGRMKIDVSRPSDGKWDHVAVEYKDDPDPKDMTYMWVPWDSDADRLPDKWEKDQTDPDDLAKYAFDTDDDDDPHTASSNTGDGLFAFEEYRGFHQKGNWSRIDPKKKDLFIRTSIGTANIGPATDLAIHEVEDTTEEDTNEMTSTNTVTENCCASPEDEYGNGLEKHVQHGIRVIEDTQQTVPPYGTAHWGTPNDTSTKPASVHIYSGAIGADAGSYGTTADVFKRHVLTHEIGHQIKLTPAHILDLLGQHHHFPTANGCAMYYNTTPDSASISDLCGTCKDYFTLH